MVLADDAPVGASLREALQLDDTLFTLKLTPNRADCLSILGVAREVAALTGAPLHEPVAEPVRPTLTEVLPVRVHAPDLCGRFAGRIVRGVNARAKSPRLAGATSGALRTALCDSAGGYFELHHVAGRSSDSRV